jgi:hypothetical protein
MIQLTISCPASSPLIISIEPDCLGSDLKTRIIQSLPHANNSELRLVCGGKVLQDHLSLQGQGKDHYY